MKTKIIPSINVKNFHEMKKRVDLLKEIINYFHLDIVTKDFANYQTFNNYNYLSRFEEKIFFEIHLMTFLRAQEIFKWAKENVKRLFLHLEASFNPNSLLKLAKKTKKEIFLTWSPKVDFDVIKKYLNYVDGLMILGVNPGKSGQEFLTITYQKIEQVKKFLKPKQKLVIDGGINKKNILKILEYNPDQIIIGSAIYDCQRPKEKYLEFLNLINQK